MLRKSLTKNKKNWNMMRIPSSIPHQEIRRKKESGRKKVNNNKLNNQIH
jgi:hypothetical protein